MTTLRDLELDMSNPADRRAFSAWQVACERGDADFWALARWVRYLEAQIAVRDGESRAFLRELLAEVWPAYAEACEQHLWEG